MVEDSLVPRPTKKRPYTLHFATRQAEKGWRDLQATRLNALVEIWYYVEGKRVMIEHIFTAHPNATK